MLGNVWKTAFSCKLSYYLTHPWKWVRDLGYALKWTFQRSVRGFACIDWFNLYDWMIDVLPAMFDDFAKYHYGYPGEENGFTDEQWTQYLKEIAAHMRNASEDQEREKNQFEEKWSAVSDARSAKANRFEDEKGFIHHVFPELTSDEKELRDKYFQRESEIDEWRLNEARTALRMIGDNFFSLWD